MVRIPCDKYTHRNPRLMLVILKVPRGLIILQPRCQPCQDSLLNQSPQNHQANQPFTDRITSTRLWALLLHNCCMLTELIKHNWPLSVQYHQSFKLTRFAVMEGNKTGIYLLRKILDFVISLLMHICYIFLCLVALLHSQQPILLTDNILRFIFVRQEGSTLVVYSDLSHNLGQRTPINFS